MNTPNPHHGQNTAVLLSRTYVFAAFGALALLSLYRPSHRSASAHPTPALLQCAQGGITLGPERGGLTQVSVTVAWANPATWLLLSPLLFLLSRSDSF
jgi:hypothetical protein